MRRYVIVANQTLGGEQLAAKLAECMGAGACRFYLAVPVTQIEGYSAWGAGSIEGYVPNAYKIARVPAEGRLQHELVSWNGSRLRRSSSPPCPAVCPAGW